jgi:predicted adenine nucleotide alpha hydrolase (AANH) superfamily ATPase
MGNLEQSIAYQTKVSDNCRPVLTPPLGETRILLHSCCAPCSGEITQALLAANLDVTVFFYNPNIHPRAEYEIRKQENIEFAKKYQVPFIDADYDCDNWFSRVKGLEHEPERGKRCSVCFDLRLWRTALFAHEHGFKVFTSSLGISRWKDMNQVNQSGFHAAHAFPETTYWAYNWRKQGGSQRMVEVTKQENFYRQEYCGCVYSLRDMNAWRQQRKL